jgi:predicted  nucleic acid-binding Zn-ribbon protein
MVTTKQRLSDLEKKSEKIQEEIARKEQDLVVVRNEIEQLEADQQSAASLLADLEVQKQQIESRLRAL